MRRRPNDDRACVNESIDHSYHITGAAVLDLVWPISNQATANNTMGVR